MLDREFDPSRERQEKIILFRTQIIEQIRHLLNTQTDLRDIARLLGAEDFLTIEKQHGKQSPVARLNIQEFIERQVERNEFLRLPHSFKKLNKVIHPPDEGEIIRGSGEGIDPKEIIHRVQLVEEVLFDLGDVYHLLDGVNTSEMVRNLSYHVFYIPSRNKLISVNNEAENASFVIHDVGEDYLKFLDWKKSELRASPQVSAFKWPGSDKLFKERLRNLLTLEFTPRLKKEESERNPESVRNSESVKGEYESNEDWLSMSGLCDYLTTQFGISVTSFVVKRLINKVLKSENLPETTDKNPESKWYKQSHIKTVRDGHESYGRLAWYLSPELIKLVTEEYKKEFGYPIVPEESLEGYHWLTLKGVATIYDISFSVVEKLANKILQEKGFAKVDDENSESEWYKKYRGKYMIQGKERIDPPSFHLAPLAVKAVVERYKKEIDVEFVPDEELSGYRWTTRYSIRDIVSHELKMTSIDDGSIKEIADTLLEKAGLPKIDAPNPESKWYKKYRTVNIVGDKKIPSQVAWHFAPELTQMIIEKYKQDYNFQMMPEETLNGYRWMTIWDMTKNLETNVDIILAFANEFMTLQGGPQIQLEGDIPDNPWYKPFRSRVKRGQSFRPGGVFWYIHPTAVQFISEKSKARDETLIFAPIGWRTSYKLAVDLNTTPDTISEIAHKILDEKSSTLSNIKSDWCKDYMAAGDFHKRIQTKKARVVTHYHPDFVEAIKKRYESEYSIVPEGWKSEKQLLNFFSCGEKTLHKIADEILMEHGYPKTRDSDPKSPWYIRRRARKQGDTAGKFAWHFSPDLIELMRKKFGK